MSLRRIGQYLRISLRFSNGFILALLSLMLLVGNVIYGAVGLRGTDQYWYVGDLRMSKITGMPVTNAIYPTAIRLNAKASLEALPPRIHNVPVTYLADLVYRIGATDYLAWVYVNFFISLIVAASVYLVAKSQRYHTAYIASAFFLSFPLTLWLSINALADMSLALGSSLLLLGAAILSRTLENSEERTWLGLLITALGSLLMFYTRDNYVLLFPAQVVVTFWVCRSHRKRWISATSILVVTGLLAALKPVFFPQYVNSGTMSALMSGTPSDNILMSSYNHLSHVPFSASELFVKAVDGLRNAVLPTGPSEVITVTLVVIVAVAALYVFRKDHNSRILRFWMFVVIFIYLTTAAFFQSQDRYIFALVPFVAVFGAGLMDRIIVRSSHRSLRILSLASVWLLIACVFASFLMARSYRTEATTAVVQNTKLVAGLAGEPSGSVLAVTETSQLLPLTYAAVPRPVLALDPRINSSAEAAHLIQDWKVRVLVGATTADFQYLTHAVDLAFDGRARLIPQSSYGTPGGLIKLWLIELKA